jgi:hypothetical protein
MRFRWRVTRLRASDQCRVAVGIHVAFLVAADFINLDYTRPAGLFAAGKRVQLPEGNAGRGAEYFAGAPPPDRFSPCLTGIAGAIGGT